jgi:ankyrin repeat protein
MAAWRGDQAVVAALIEDGADVNAYNCVRALGFCFGDPHVSQSHAVGDTPLHEAAKFGRTELARLLLAHGAHASAEDNVSKDDHHSSPFGSLKALLLSAVR